MFTISNEAEIYIAELFVDQGEKDLGLKVEVEKAGTPVAAVTFNFCRPSELHKKHKKFSYIGFDVYVSVSYIDYLKDAEERYDFYHQKEIKIPFVEVYE